MIENKCVTIQSKNSSDFGKLIYHEQWISNSHTSFEQIFCRIMETWFSKGHKVSFLCQNIYVIFELKNTKNQRKSEFWSSPSVTNKKSHCYLHSICIFQLLLLNEYKHRIYQDKLFDKKINLPFCSINSLFAILGVTGNYTPKKDFCSCLIWAFRSNPCHAS